jgi:hypothetical protein
MGGITKMETQTVKDLFKTLMNDQNIKNLDEILMFTAHEMEINDDDKKYAIWVDIMGAGNTMRDSMHRAVNIISRLHLSIQYIHSIKEENETFEIIPVNDGCFILTKRKDIALKIISNLNLLMGYYFIKRNNPWERFPIRISISYGPVVNTEILYHKTKLEKIKNLPDYAFGPAIIQAYECERNCPPFGVYIHESARAFSNKEDSIFTGKYHRWWFDSKTKSSVSMDTFGNHKINMGRFKDILKTVLEKHFDWMIENPYLCGIDSIKSLEYKKHSQQYFSF